MKTETKIQLLHPEGKRANRMDIEKYEPMRKAILLGLKKEALTHTELNESVHEYFRKNKIKFEGSIDWYMETVKLDMEARKTVERFKDKSKLMYQIKK